MAQLVADIDAMAGGGGATIDGDAIRIDDSEELKVLAPATGIFYITPSPAEPEYVAEGDKVDGAHTLCQLEAMKNFTPLTLSDFGELYSEDHYEVTRINVSSGQQVGPGDLLFVVKPVLKESA